MSLPDTCSPAVTGGGADFPESSSQVQDADGVEPPVPAGVRANVSGAGWGAVGNVGSNPTSGFSSLLAAVAPPPGDSGLSTPTSGAATSPGADCSGRGMDAPLADIGCLRGLPPAERRAVAQMLIRLAAGLGVISLILGTAAAAYGAWRGAQQPMRIVDVPGRLP